MLASAFSMPYDASGGSSNDEGKVFRIITGGAYKEIDDHGNLVERTVTEVEPEVEPGRSSTLAAAEPADARSTEQLPPIKGHPSAAPQEWAAVTPTAPAADEREARRQRHS